MSIAQVHSERQSAMPLPSGQDVLESSSDARARWLAQAAHALYEAQRAEYPERYPLPWDMAEKAARDDCRYRAMGAHRRGQPYAKEALVERMASEYANLEGWVYPDCDNKRGMDVAETDRPALAAQRRQAFRHKARQIVAAVFRYLEYDTDTEEQRKKEVDRAGGQLMADRMVVAHWREHRGMPSEVNRG